MNIKNRNKKLNLLAFCVIVGITIALALLCFLKPTMPSHLVTASKQNYNTGVMISMEISEEEIREAYDNFSLGVSENLAELSFLKKTPRSYYIEPDGDIIKVTPELNTSIFNKSAYARIDDVVYTMHVDKVYYGKIQENSTIDIVVQPIGIKIGNCLETNNVIVAFHKTNEKNIYELQMQYQGIFYKYNNKVYPAMNMTYSEVYGVKDVGNPVEKYMGIPVNDFEKELNELFK